MLCKYSLTWLTEPKNVITSYSIHYTKLYEKRRDVQRRSEVIREQRDVLWVRAKRRDLDAHDRQSIEEILSWIGRPTLVVLNQVGAGPRA